MATFTVDPSDPSFVVDASGRSYPASSVDPADVEGSNMSAAPAEPVMSVAPTTAAAAPTPAEPANAKTVLAKLDAVTAPLNQGRGGLVQTGASTSTIAGRDAGAVRSDIASSNAATEGLVSGVQALGDKRADRGEAAAQRGAGQAVAGFYDARAEQAKAEAELKANREAKLSLETQPDPQVDPDRYIKSLSTGKDIALIILGALNGAFKGAVGQQGNDVVDILDKKIDQDLAIQRDQVAAGRADRKNKIAELVNRGYDLESAAKLAKAQALQYTAKFYDQEAAGSAAGEFRDQAALDAAKLRAAGAAEVRQLAQSGESRSQSGKTFARPTAVDPRDSALKDAKLAEAQGKASKAATDASNAQLEQEDAGSISQKIGRPVSPDRLKQIRQEVVQVRPAVAELEPLASDLEAVVKFADPNATLDRRTGQITWSGKDLNGVSTVRNPFGKVTGGLISTDADKLDALTGRVTQRVTKDITGANSSVKQDKTFENMSGSGAVHNEQSFKDALEHTYQSVANQRQVHLNALGRDGKAYFELTQQPVPVTGVIK